MVSRQAGRLVQASPPIASAHFRAEADPFHPRHNPGGYVNLGTAENRLMWDLLAPRFASVPPQDAAGTRYAPLYGSPALRAAVAGFLSADRAAAAVDPEDVVVVAGATAALDVIATALCDPGEEIAVPAPYYGAFDVDLVGRSGARLLPVPLPPGEGFPLLPGAVRESVISARSEGRTVRALALTSPSNPIGQVYSEKLLYQLLKTAAELDLDVISDELYAHCVFGERPFTALADVAGSPLPAERIHTVWGFAKDFALPGYKAGVLHTVCAPVRAAARELAYFAPLSTHTQAVLTALLEDPSWTAGYLAESRKRLAASYASAARALTRNGLPFLPAQAGFSVWTDLRAHLAADGFEAEETLRRDLFEKARVSMLPGRMFSCPQPGWFRLCHTPADAETVGTAVDRLGRLLRGEERPQ